MATGDVTLTLAIEGSSTKTITLSSMIRTKAKSGLMISEDVDWAISQINKWGFTILAQANNQLQVEASWTPSVFTQAT